MQTKLGLRSAAGIAVIGAALLPPSVALAQNAASDTKAAASDTSDIAEVVVTAQRREEKSRDVPISVTALSADQLATAHVEQLSDTAKVTPGLRFDAAGPAVQPSIRGVGTAITTSGGGPNVGIYVDGFFRANTYASDFQLLNVKSIQVLKGPQGTLFGRNTTGGAILVSTTDPSTQTSAQIKAGYARYNAPSVQAYATTGIGDHLAVDIEGLYRRGDGYYTDVLNHDDQVGQYRNWSVRTGAKADFGPFGSLLLRYEHSAMNDPSTLMYNAFVDKSGDARFFSTVQDPQSSYGYSSSKGVALVNLQTPADLYTTRPGDIALNKPVSFRLRTNAVEATYKTDLDFAELTSYTQYRHDYTPYYDDLDSTAAPVLTLYIGVKDTTISQEFLLNSRDTDARLQWTVGANYFYYKDDWSDLKASGLTPTFGTDPDTSNLQPFGGSSTTTGSIATFADATYALVPERLFLTLGGRFSHDTVKDAYFNSNQFTPYTGYTGRNGEHIDFSGNPQTRIDVPDLSNNQFTPRVVLRYKPGERSSVYASYTQGYKAGILNVGGYSLQPIKPEKNNAYEIGYKYEQRGLAVDLASFLYDYKDLQVSSFQAGTAQITNAATARVYGAEAQLRYSVTHQLDVNAGATWTHARYRSFKGAPFYGYCDPAVSDPTAPTYCTSGQGSIVQVRSDASGDRLQRSPAFTANLGANYLIPTAASGAFTLSGNLYYSSDFYFDPSEQFRQGAYSVLSLRAQWDDPSGRYSVALYGDNIGNEHYLSYINANTTSIQAIWASPITYGVSVSAHF
ncbi:TonB-dependent receptor [Solimonas marina]|uniref:TonB-dependent receptor n=1 Tax=Solimonas marina TaxID=2714601 RepID=A0A969WAA3_9GAMM|nr:TonB-dependent receptor [Solimonas marina]NKF22444.1 TonB-dependent receptor [Solimonas marina]